MEAPHLLRHEGCHGAAKLCVVRVGGLGAQQHHEEAHGPGQLHVLQLYGFLQPHKGQHRLLQEVGVTCRERGPGLSWAGEWAQWARDGPVLTHVHQGSLGALWNLLQNCGS